MQVVLTPVTPVAIEKYTIQLGSNPIGFVKAVEDSDHYKFHAVIDSKYKINVYQGFGNTIDDAMRNAIQVAVLRRQQELTELDELENAIWGDHEIN